MTDYPYEGAYPTSPEDFEKQRQKEEFLRMQALQAQQLRQSEAPQMGGMNPGMAQQFMPSSAPAASSGGAAGGTTGGAAGGTAGGTAGGASSSGGGMAAAAWPAALVAVIAANETWANKQGRRPEKFKDHAQDMATGKVLEYDAKALSDKMPGKSGEFLELGAEMGNPEGAWKNIKKASMPWEWF